MRRLIRESNPPSGQLASPVPQYWNPSTEAFEDVLGAHGAPRAILYDPNGQPIGTQTNPLDVRVRRKSAVEEVLPRAIRTSGIHPKTVQVPDGVTAAVFMLYVHGRTGTFESGQGASLEVVTSGFAPAPALHGYGASTRPRANQFSYHQIFIGLGLGSGDGEDQTWSSSAVVPCVLWPGGYIYARAYITGTFAAGEGMDTEIRVAWIF